MSPEPDQEDRKNQNSNVIHDNIGRLTDISISMDQQPDNQKEILNSVNVDNLEVNRVDPFVLLCVIWLLILLILELIKVVVRLYRS